MSARCRVMGILNVTPDSFSDGGKYFSVPEAVRRAVNMAEEGADMIDIGGESTRPGATPLAWDEEWSRVEPVLKAVRPELAGSGIEISIDTYHPETAARALDLGAAIVNCVYADPVPEMARICSARSAGLVAPVGAGIPDGAVPGNLYFDPMIGFGTTREEDLRLLRSVPELAAKLRILVGASRKRIVKRLTGERKTGKSIGGNVAIAVWCALSGAAAVRVHDVRETVEALRTAEAIRG